MIKEAKDVLQSVISERLPSAVIVRSVAEESRKIMARKFPIVSLITNPGRFDDRNAKIVRYADAETKTIKERVIRGSRIIPILLHVWGEGEEDTDENFSRLIPAIPKKWTLEDFEGSIVINQEEHSDFVDSVSKLYLSVLEIQFTMPVALEATDIPTIKNVESEPETNAS